MFTVTVTFVRSLLTQVDDSLRSPLDASSFDYLLLPHSVVITMSVPGVEPALVRARIDVPSVAAAVQGSMLKYAGKFVIAGIDWCDRLSGLPLKLLAFKRLLTDRPELASKVVFVQIAHNAATTNVAGQETEGNTHELIVGAGKSIGELVAAINDEFGGGEQIVEYLEVSLCLAWSSSSSVSSSAGARATSIRLDIRIHRPDGR